MDPTRPRLTARVIEFSHGEYAVVRHAAERAGISVRRWLHDTVVRAAAPADHAARALDRLTTTEGT